MFSDDQNIDRLYANDNAVAVYVGTRPRIKDNWGWKTTPYGRFLMWEWAEEKEWEHGEKRRDQSGPA